MKTKKWIRTIGAIVLLVALVGALPAGRSTVRLFDAFDVAAGTFVYCDSTSPPTGVTCATGAATDDGWVTGIRGMDAKVVIVRPDTVDLTSGSIQVTIEGRVSDASGSYATMDLVAPVDFAAAQAGVIIQIIENVEQLRVGLRINGVDNANADSVTVHFDGGQ